MNLSRRLATLLLLLAILVACGGGDAEPAEPTPDGNEATRPTPTISTGGETGETPTEEELPSIELPQPETGEVPTLSGDAITTDSGLQYESTRAGEGAAATEGDLAFVHYTGYLDDGTIFDSSVGSGNPFSFALGSGQVIQGWDEGILGMQVGEKRILRIPPELGYGDSGQGLIPPGATLTFEVELVDLQALPALELADSFEQTESGLEYAIIEEGEGEPVTEGALVTINYSAFLEDGTLFDTSTQAPNPAQFTLGTAGLSGLNEGIVGMRAGERRQLRIPPELAFGAQGSGGVIPPNATVIFDIELVEFEALPSPPEVDEFTELDGGLEYAIIEEGDGDVAEEGDTVQVHYQGWLEDGLLFDSSRRSDQPFTFTLGQGQVIQGWDQGVIGMKVGETRLLRIPSDLAYGSSGIGGIIPPDATLLFEVELLDVQ